MVCVACALVAGQAGAQALDDDTPKAVLIVHPEGADAEAVAARLFSRLSVTLAQSKQFEAVSLVELVGGEAGGPAVPPDARKRFGLARKAYDNLELDRAVTLLERAVLSLEGNLPNGLDLELYTQVLIYLGASKVLVGNQAGGRAVFRKLAGINPAAEINPMIFPPSLVKAFKEETDKLAKAPTGSLDLRSQPAGAAIWLDGQQVGSTPRRLTELTPGPHLVRLTRFGHRPVGELVKVPQGGRHTYAQSLVALAGAERLRFLASRLCSAVGRSRYPKAVDEALRWAKADRLLLLTVVARPDALRIDGYHFDGLASERLRARRVELAPTAADLDARVEAFFKGLYRDRLGDLPAGLAWLDLDPDPSKIPVDDPPPGGGQSSDDQDSILTSWWFWTVVGVVVVGGAGVAVGLTLGQGEEANAGDVIFRF